MKMMKALFTIAMLMALTIILAITLVDVEEESQPPSLASSSFDPIRRDEDVIIQPLSNNRVSRFLAQTSSSPPPPPPSTLNQCGKDNKKCQIQGKNSTGECCNNKCINMQYNSNNCGGCNQKCKYTQVCCRGKCVITAFDKRHCGKCNNRCTAGTFCVYGMCDYA